MAARDLWHGYTASLVQTLRKCDSCLHLSGAARTALALVSGHTQGYMRKVLPTYCLSPNEDQLSMQLIWLSHFGFQPLLRHLPAPTSTSHFSAQAQDMALIVLAKNFGAV